MQTPMQRLFKAAATGNVIAAKRALTDGADVNVKDEQDCTPLHWAVRGGHAESCTVAD